VTEIGDAALSRLRAAVREPDLSGTRYRIVSIAGQGGMGTVYVAEDTALGRKVALKVVELPGPLEDRLLREAQILARLEHPGIVPVHDLGTLPDGRPWYAMKLVQGERLDDVLRAPVALGERLRIFLRICEAVAFAHAHGVLHRDLKPANVMIGPFGEVLVLDWGLAGDAGDAARVGTSGYAPPAPVGDARDDVYSLGMLLQAMPPLPRELAAVAAKATAAPAERYASVPALADDVARFLEGAAVTALPEGPLRKVQRLVRKHRIAAAIVVAYLTGRALIYLATGR
jgi:serine/threonine protein kinase